MYGNRIGNPMSSCETRFPQPHLSLRAMKKRAVRGRQSKKSDSCVSAETSSSLSTTSNGETKERRKERTGQRKREDFRRFFSSIKDLLRQTATLSRSLSILSKESPSKKDNNRCLPRGLLFSRSVVASPSTAAQSSVVAVLVACWLAGWRPAC